MTTRKLLTIDLTVEQYLALADAAERAGLRPEALVAVTVVQWLTYRRGETETETV